MLKLQFINCKFFVNIPISFSFPFETEYVTLWSIQSVVHQLPLIELLGTGDQIARVLSNDFPPEKQPGCSNTQTALSCFINLNMNE